MPRAARLGDDDHRSVGVAARSHPPHRGPGGAAGRPRRGARARGRAPPPRTPAGSTRTACSSTPAPTSRRPLVASLYEAALAAQPSMGYPGAKYQAGLEPIDVVEVTAATAIARVMGARFAEVRPTSATLANLAVYTALTEPGDTIAVLPDWAGGHLSHHEVGVPGHPRAAGRAAALRHRGAGRRPRRARRRSSAVEAPRLVVVGREPDAVRAPAARDRGVVPRARHPAALRRLARRRPDRRAALPGPAARGRGPDDVLDLQVLRRPAGRRDRHRRRGARRARQRRRLPEPRGQLRRLAPAPARGRRARARGARAASTPTSASPTPARSRRRWPPRASTCSAPDAASPTPTTSRCASATAPPPRSASPREHPQLGDRRPGRPRGRHPPRHPGDHPPGLRRGRHARDRARRSPARCCTATCARRSRRSAPRHSGLRWCLTPRTSP